MARLGMDADAVERVGRELGSTASRMQRVVTDIDRLVGSLPGQWLGPAATRYVNLWQGSLRRQTAHCAEQVATLGRTALDNAAEQRRVSGTLAGSSTPVTWPGTLPQDSQPTPPPTVGHTTPRPAPPEKHWWDTAWDGAKSVGATVYNHTAVPLVNGVASVGQAMIHHPEDVAGLLLGGGMIILGSGVRSVGWLWTRPVSGPWPGCPSMWPRPASSPRAPPPWR